MREEKKRRYSKAQQFAEQMDQLCGPNYRREEVGALGENVNKEGGGGGVDESRWRSGRKGTNVTGGRVARGGKWPIRKQAISLADE